MREREREREKDRERENKKLRGLKIVLSYIYISPNIALKRLNHLSVLRFKFCFERERKRKRDNS